MDRSFNFNNEDDLNKLLHMKESIDDNDEIFNIILKCFCKTSEVVSTIDFSISDHCPSTESKKNHNDKSQQQKMKINEKCTVNTSFSAVNKYRDCANIPENFFSKVTPKNMRGCYVETFPTKLFKILQQSDASRYSSIIL